MRTGQVRDVVAAVAPAAHRCARSLLPGLLLCLLPAVSQAASLYLCKAYSGGSFWSADHCQNKQALIDRIVSVPDGMPFDQQVLLGEQARSEGDRLRQPDPAGGKAVASQGHKPAHRAQAHKDRQTECAALDNRVTKLDALARQPQSGSAQDKLTAQKHKLRQRQAELHC